MEAQNRQPLVSAVITTHNRKELAIKAIDSVLNQTYENMELIVVDDASEKASSDCLRAKAEAEHFTYVYIDPSETKGGNHARNVGIDTSKGAYVAFLDDDDEWMPEKTALQVEFLNTHPDYGVISCLRLKEFDFEKREVEKRKKIEGDISELIFTCIPYLTSTIMVRKEVLIEIGKFDEDLRYWQEYDLAIRYAAVSKTACLDQPLCLYRIIHKDKKRLTNNLDGWEGAVQYIDRKYSDRISRLPADYAKKHKLLIAKDGVTRAQNAGNHKQLVHYSKEVMKLDPSVRNAVKLLLSFCNIRW